jgi:uncharacterized protein with HEPN domain
LYLSEIVEVAARVSEKTRGGHLEVPWTQIVGFRNIPVHSYFGIEWEVVWRVSKNRCPELRAALEGIIATQSLGERGNEQDIQSRRG